MDILNQLNSAIDYIETHLDTDINMREAAKIACESEDGFKRIFRSLTGMTVNEYIRKRRLSIAVDNLHNGEKVIDIAIKYGYNSADSFRRAFITQHGITPINVRNSSVSVNIYPPVSFHIKIKGAEKMNFKIVEKEEMIVHGFSKKLDVAAETGGMMNALCGLRKANIFLKKSAAATMEFGMEYGIRATIPLQEKKKIRNQITLKST